MFTGFDLKYPDYEVLTPQTGLSYKLRSLNVQEEERLKGSLITAAKVTDHLNKCIYEALTKKPKSIKDYDSFLESTTLKDRDALIYALYHVTYEEIRNYDISCGTCGKSYSVTIDASSTFNVNPYPDDDILSKKVEVDLPVSKGVKAIIKQPTLANEVNCVKELSSRPGSTIDVITEILIVDKFVHGEKEYTDPVDILDAYLSLPSRDKRKISKEYAEKFGVYGINLKMNSMCRHCSAKEDVDIDIVAQFFRSLYE